MKVCARNVAAAEASWLGGPVGQEAPRRTRDERLPSLLQLHRVRAPFLLQLHGIRVDISPITIMAIAERNERNVHQRGRKPSAAGVSSTASMMTSFAAQLVAANAMTTARMTNVAAAPRGSRNHLALWCGGL